MLFPGEVAITYCTEAFELALVLPKFPAAFTASAASCDWVGCDGAVEPVSYQVSTYIPASFPACCGLDGLHVLVPLATPWQYWATLFNHWLPPTFL
jgi:hypothetical protein